MNGSFDNVAVRAVRRGAELGRRSHLTARTATLSNDPFISQISPTPMPPYGIGSGSVQVRTERPFEMTSIVPPTTLISALCFERGRWHK